MPTHKNKLSEAEILTSFRDNHGNKYEYPPFPELFYVTSIIDIICPIHGLFKQSILHHKNGQGCPECGRLKRTGERAKVALGRDEWIRRFEAIHGRGKYDYSRVPDNVRQKNKVEIFCPEHNITFYQTPDTHWRFHKGCPKCGIVKQWETRKQNLITRREFEKRARAIHGLAFEYSELPQEFSLNDTIIIYCNEHNHIFFCIAQEHLKGKGCPVK